MNNIIVDHNDLELFDRASVGSFVGMLVGDIDRKIVIQSRDQNQVGDRDVRGSCVNFKTVTTLTIYLNSIRSSVNRGQSLGGNRTPGISIREGAYLVLAHELRHAQQYAINGHPRMAAGVPYHKQWYEVDARDSVDLWYHSIVAFVRELPGGLWLGS